MTRSSSIVAHLIMAVARVLGGSSLLALGLFLLLGPIYSLDLGLSTSGALALDALLCLAFFVQHSGMVRQSFRNRLATIVSGHYTDAIYTITSGCVLLVLLVLWQPTDPSLVHVEGPFRWLLRALYAAGIVGFVWGIRSLGSFDGFGVRPIKAELSGRELRTRPLTIRGPYRWVRHPLYTCVLLLLWSYPDLTADRLILNSTWTVWVFVGTVLEERDLVAVFGDQYREYQRRVPMLVPVVRARRPRQEPG